MNRVLAPLISTLIFSFRSRLAFLFPIRAGSSRFLELEEPLSVPGLSALMRMADCQGALGRWSEAVSTVVPAVSLAVDALGQVGMMFAIDGRIIGFDLFDCAETLRRLFPKLIRSNALDALDASLGKEAEAKASFGGRRRGVPEWGHPGQAGDFPCHLMRARTFGFRHGA
jgi:hypothetical protein